MYLQECCHGDWQGQLLFHFPKELCGNDGSLESSPGARNDIKNLQISEQVVARTSFSLVVINRILQHFDEKWLIWQRSVERGTGFGARV